jgi:hypothetical protein
MPRIQSYLAIALVAVVLPFAQLSCAQSLQSSSRLPSLEKQVEKWSTPAVVRVVSGCYLEYDQYFYAYGGKSTGFFINPDGYIATRSVITESDCKERIYNRLVKDFKDREAKLTTDETTIKGNVQYVHSVNLPQEEKSDPNPTPFKIEDSSPPLDKGGRGVAIIKVEVENAPVLKLANSDKKLDTQDEVLVIGYPYAADETPANKAKVEEFTTQNFLSPKSEFEASIFKGRVSSADKTLSDNTRILQLDVQGGGYGSAGSPVLNKEGEVVGMIAATEIDDRVFDLYDFVDKKDDVDGESDLKAFNRLMREIQGIPIAVPNKKIQQSIRESGAENQQGKNDEYYRDGLALFWDGDYRAAKEKFDNVQRNFPQHSEINNLMRDISAGIVEQGRPNDLMFWGPIAAIIAAILGLLGVLFWRNSRTSGSGIPRQKGTSIKPPFSTNFNTNVNTSVNGSNANGSTAQAWLELEGQGEYCRLPLKGNIHKIGRDPAWSDLKDIPKKWEIFSRKQAVLRKEGDGYRLFDGDGKTPSRNGLWIDQYTRIDATQGYLLQPGDELKIGSNPNEQVSITYYSTAVHSTVSPTKMAGD